MTRQTECAAVSIFAPVFARVCAPGARAGADPDCGTGAVLNKGDAAPADICHIMLQGDAPMMPSLPDNLAPP